MTLLLPKILYKDPLIAIKQNFYTVKHITAIEKFL